MERGRVDEIGGCVICAGCGEDVTVTLVVIGRGERSHLCRRCYFIPKPVVILKEKRKR